MNREDVNLFIASSSELADERKEFDAIVIKLGQSFDHLHLHVFKWEYNIPSGSYPGKGRIQDAINPHLNKSDIIIVLFYSRIGKFTREELNFGLSENKKIFLYFKTGFSPRTVQEGKDYSELLGFKQGVTEENKILFKEFKDHEDFSYILNEDISRYFRETYPFVQKADAKKEERENRSQFVGIHHYKLPKNFVGRITETEKIYNLLMETKTSSSISKIVSLIGVGGIGKSSLARYIVEKFVSNQKEFVYIIWYSFSSANSDDEGYLFRCITKYIQPHKYEIGQETQKESTYYVDLVKEILKTNKVLLILDNFETIQFLNDRKSAKFGSISKNYKLIKELFEFISDHAKSKILLTSRTNVIDLYDNAFHEEINLNTLNEEDGASLLEKTGVRASRKELIKLSNSLGNHALILKAVGNLIRIKRLKPQDYRSFIGPSVFNSIEEGAKVVEVLNLYREFLSEKQKYFLVMLSCHVRDVSEEALELLIKDYDSEIDTVHEVNQNIVIPLLNLGLIEERIIDEVIHFHIHPLMKFAFNNWWAESSTKIAYEKLADAAQAEGSFLPSVIESVEQLQIYFDLVHYYIKANKSQRAFDELESRYSQLRKYMQDDRLYNSFKEIEVSDNLNEFDIPMLYIRIAETSSNKLESNKYFKKALDLSEKNPHYGVSSDELKSVCIVNFIKGGYFEDVESILENERLKKDNLILGYLNYYRGNYCDGIDYLRNYLGEIWDGHHKRRVIQRLAPMLMFTGNYDKCEELLNEALIGAISNDDSCCILPIYRYNIDLAICQKNLEKAETLYKDMMEYSKKKGVEPPEVYSYFFQKKQFELISRKLRKDLEESIENNDIPGMILYNLMYAKLFWINEEQPSMQKHLNEAKKLMKESKVYRDKYILDSFESNKEDLI